MKKTIYIADMSGISADTDSFEELYDRAKLISNFQGLYNREGPYVFTRFDEQTDDFWTAYMRQRDARLRDCEALEIRSFPQFLSLFEKELKGCGLVLWDPAVPATSNVATTVCGCDGYLPVRKGSSLEQVLRQQCGLEVRLDLSEMFTGKGMIPGTGLPSTGSAKCDAYRWALERYGDRVNPCLLGYQLDAAPWDGRMGPPDIQNAFIPNQDYMVYHRAFVFDLFMWEDEAPCDDPGQTPGTDLDTMKSILTHLNRRNQCREIITICGFVPWHQKYTTHLGKSSHDPVPSEWRCAEIFSAYNAILDADAAGTCGLANASAYCQFPLADQYRAHRPKQIPAYDPYKTYILLYLGDYDSAAWLSRFVPLFWKDKSRGKVPLCWGYNPNLSDRNPLVFDYIYREMTPNDYFVGGDSGAGYLNPRLLFPPRIHSNLPDGSEAWERHNRQYYEKFGLTITGFLLNGAYAVDDRVRNLYQRFSPDGVGTYGGEERARVGNTVFLRQCCDIADPSVPVDEALRRLRNHAVQPGEFYLFRSILCSPSYIEQLILAAQDRYPEMQYTFVDPYTFFCLQEQLEEG